MTFLSDLARLREAATTSSRMAQLECYLRNHAEAIEELVRIVDLQNRNWQSPAVTEALEKLNRSE